jgi:hypothetical protein
MHRGDAILLQSKDILFNFRIQEQQNKQTVCNMMIQFWNNGMLSAAP